MTWLADLTLDDVIVHMKTGDSMRGLVTSIYSDCVILKNARMLEDEGMSQVLNGEPIIPRDNVGWIQNLPAEAP